LLRRLGKAFALRRCSLARAVRIVAVSHVWARFRRLYASVFVWACFFSKQRPSVGFLARGSSGFGAQRSGRQWLLCARPFIHAGITPTGRESTELHGRGKARCVRRSSKAGRYCLFLRVATLCSIHARSSCLAGAAPWAVLSSGLDLKHGFDFCAVTDHRWLKARSKADRLQCALLLAWPCAQ